MNLFETVKSAITVRQSAELCGLKVERNDVCICPFHADRTPSMKLYPDHYYCFGCHEHGDAIDLTAKLLNITPGKAALQLAEAFHIDISNCEKTYCHSACHRTDLNALAEKLAQIRRKDEAQGKEDLLNHAQKVLQTYLGLLRNWKDKYAPALEDDNWHPLFVEACQKEAWIEYLTELTNDPQEKLVFYENYQQEIETIEKRINEYNLEAPDERGVA